MKRRTANIKPRTVNMILKKGSPTLKLLLSVFNDTFAEVLNTVDTILVELIGWRAFVVVIILHCSMKLATVPGIVQLNFAVSTMVYYFYKN